MDLGIDIGTAWLQCESRTSCGQPVTSVIYSLYDVVLYLGLHIWARFEHGQRPIYIHNYFKKYTTGFADDEASSARSDRQQAVDWFMLSNVMLSHVNHHCLL